MASETGVECVIVYILLFAISGINNVDTDVTYNKSIAIYLITSGLATLVLDAGMCTAFFTINNDHAGGLKYVLATTTTLLLCSFAWLIYGK